MHIHSHCIALLQGQEALPACSMCCFKAQVWHALHDIALLQISGQAPSAIEDISLAGPQPCPRDFELLCSMLCQSSESVTAVSLCC